MIGTVQINKPEVSTQNRTVNSSKVVFKAAKERQKCGTHEYWHSGQEHKKSKIIMDCKTRGGQFGQTGDWPQL